MKFLAGYIMRGRVEAAFAAATLGMMSLQLALLSMPLSVLSAGAVALVTLRKGAKEGFIVLASSSLAAAVLATLIQFPYLYIALYALVVWLPIWLIAIVLREGRHISLAVEIAVLLGIVAVIGYYLINANPALMWQQALSKMVPSDAPVDAEEVKRMVGYIAPYMTGIFAASGVFSLLLGLFLGRWWQALLYNPGGFKEEFLGLKVQPRLATICFVIIGVGFISSGAISQIAWNTAIIMFVLYAFIGTAVLHAVFAKMKSSQYAVPMFYITLISLFRLMLPVVALVGLGDTWLDLRNRKFKKT